jgi:hypothetical protein
MFYRGPINLIGAAVRSPVQYLSERQMQAAILDFGTIAPGRFYICLDAEQSLSHETLIQ